MRRATLALALSAAVAGGVAAHPAGAAVAKSKPLVVKDAVGDANALNTQGGILPLPESTATPVQEAGSDIVSFSLSRRMKGAKPYALVATMTLAAAPASDRNFRIRMSSPDCSTWFLEYDSSSALGSSGSFRDNCDGATTTFTPIGATVKGSTITWDVPIKALPGGVKVGTPITVQGAQVSVETAVIFPGLDEVSTTKTYRLGQ